MTTGRAAHVRTLADDLEDCARRADQLGLGEQAFALRSIGTRMRHLAEEPKRDSIPPVLALNAPTRAKSDEHFRNARKILAGVK